jgi:hypothetical protein
MTRAGTLGVAGRSMVLLLGLALLPGPGRAQSESPEELAFWQAVQQSDRSEEYAAYLQEFPNGLFAPLARLRLKRGAPQAAVTPAAPARPAPAAAQAWVRPARASVRLVDGITLDMDAEAIRTSSNLRIAVVPANDPDTIADPQRFAEDSTPVSAARLHLSVPSGPPGRDEVRLYHIPRFADTYSVAARAPVAVAPGVPGATLARDLVQEANRLGPVRFEANHRDRPLLVQAAFLRVWPRTDWNVQWFGANALQDIARQAAVVSIGQPGVAPDAQGSLGEVICVLAADEQAVLDRIAAFQTGDPVLVSGIPTSWSNAMTSGPVVLNRCALAG